MLVKDLDKTKVAAETIADTKVKHVAVIMDGNRRWAKERMLPSAVGHQRGVSALKNTIKACHKLGIEYLTVYAFSTENWNRKQEEVDFLMDLLAKTIQSELAELNKNNVRIKFIGDLERLDASLRNILFKAEAVTENNTGVKLQIAFNYGARAEIVAATKKIAQMVKLGLLNVDDIDESTITKNLYTSDIPEPDILIRTGGEKRISNYLLWQIAYSEVVVMDEFWPDFGENLLCKAIEEFSMRSRRFGK